MASAVGFYANKPLVVCRGLVLGICGSLKTRDNTSRRKLPRDERAAGRGPVCSKLAHLCFHPRSVTPPSITSDDESHGNAATLTCEESPEMAERSLAEIPEGGMPGTGLWVAKAGDG